MSIRKFFLTVLTTLISTIIFGQNLTYSDSTVKWKLGFNIGGAWQNSDVKAKAGAGMGLTLERTLIQNNHSVFGLSLRGRYLYAETYGKDYTPSTGIANNPALNGQNNPGLNYTGSAIFQNHKTAQNELSLEAMLIANRLRKQGILLYAFGGLGFTGFKASTDQLDANGNMYDYSKITGTTKSQVLSQLNSMRDGVYETNAENKGNPQWVFAPSWGIGFGFYISPKTTFGIEHKITYPHTDLLDGQQWNNVNIKTGKNDIYHYTSLGFRFGLGGGRVRTYHPTYTNNYTTVVQKPNIAITQPYQNPAYVADCKTNIIASISNVDVKQNIIVRQDGVVIDPNLYTFQSANGAFSLYMDFYRTTTISITAQNSAGTDTKYLTFNCSAQTTPVDTYTPQPKPVVRITLPSQNPYTTSVCNTSIMAIIDNISGEGNIEIRRDGQIVNNNLYDYSPISKLLTYHTILSGTNTFSILATNNAGSDIRTVTIQCNTPISRIMARPIVTINRPTTNPFVTTDCRADISAIIQNVESENNIEVRQNGNIVSSNLYFYNTQTDVLSLNIPIQDIATFTITAINTAGRDDESIIIKCQPPVINPVIPRPVITVTSPAINPFVSPDCRADINAIILNIDGKQNIEVSQNGQIISSSLYNYDVLSKIFSLYTPITEITTYIIAAVNSTGKEYATFTVKCEPKVIPAPVVQNPVISVISPLTNPFVSSDCKASINAVILNVDGEQNIEVRENGQIINSSLYNYDASSKMFSLNAPIQEISTYTITAVNSASRESVNITVKCEPKQEVPVTPKPVITITQPLDNPYLSPDCKANINAIIINISGKQSIEVRQNNQIISSTLYNYDAISKIFSLNTPIKEITTYSITAVNSVGKESTTLTVKCEPKIETPVLPEPVITVIKPLDNPNISADCRADISAAIINIDGKQNIEVRQNNQVISGTLYNYDVTSKIFSLNAAINGITTYTITAVNNTGKESTTLTVKCEPKVDSTPVTPKPVITVTNPIANPHVSADCKADINAIILNVDGKGNLEVRKNGQIISNSLYNYDTASKIFTLDAAITEITTYTITASNSAGKASTTLTIKCEPKIETPVIPNPVITVTKPTDNPYVSEDCKADITANILNIDGKQNIEVRQNGQIISSSSYNYDVASKIFSLNAPISEITTYTITAVNSTGKGTSTITVKCEPKVAPIPVIPNPVITISSPIDNPYTSPDCKANIVATILNIDGEQNIEVKQNGQVINASLYNYDAPTKTFTLNTAITDITNYTITAINSTGKDSETITIKCAPKANPTPVVPNPVITISSPTDNPYTSPDCKANIVATILNIDGEQNIEVKQNGQIINASLYNYDAPTKTFTLNTAITDITNYTITAINSTGKDSETITIKCAPKANPTPVVPNPVITISSPTDNPYTSPDCKANIVATILNIDGEQNIEVKQNGQIINASLYNYDAPTKTFTLNTAITDITNYTITAINSTGKDSETITIKCAPKANPTPVVPNPVITISSPTDNPYTSPDCKANIVATILNIDGEQNIEVKQNGQIINASLYNYDAPSKTFTLNTAITDITNYTITAINSTGKDSETITIKCAPKPVEEEKITICHIPPGNADNPQTITIAKSALQAHLDHGDKIGACDIKVVTPPNNNTGIDFDIDKGTVIPKQCYNAIVTVLGCALKEGGVGIDYPVITQVKFGNNTVDPFGTYSGYNKASNVNDHQQHTWNSSQPIPANTAISVKAKSYNPKSFTLLYERSSSSNDAFTKVLRNGDAVPKVSGYAGQGDVESFLQGYFVNEKIKLDANQAIYLFELGTNSATSQSCDLQDCVVLITLSPAQSSDCAAINNNTQDKAIKDAQDKANQEAQDRANKAAQDKAIKDAQDKANQEAQDRANKAAQDKANKAAQDKAIKDAQDKANQEAQDRANKAAQDKANQEAQDRANKAAQDKAIKDAQDKANQEAQDRANKAAQDKANQEAQDRANKEAQDQAIKDAQDKANQEAQDRANKAAQDKAIKDAQDKANQEAQDRANKAAQDQAIKDAQDKANQEAQDRANKAAQDKAIKDAQDKANQEAQDRANKEAQDQAIKDAQDRANKAAQDKAIKDAQDKANQEAQDRANKAAQDQAIKDAQDKANQEAQDRANKAAQDQAIKDAQDKANQEAQDRANKAAQDQAIKDAQDKANQEAQDRANKAAQDQAIKDAQDKANQEAQDRANKAAQDQAIKDAQDKANQEAQDRANKAAQDQAIKDAQDRAAQEKAKKDAIDKANRDAQEKARKDAEDKAKADEAERQKQEDDQKQEQQDPEKEMEKVKDKDNDDQKKDGQ